MSPQVLKKMKPGEPGTVRYHKKYKNRLVCVRYRQDLSSGIRYTTVEIIVSKRPVPEGSSAWRSAGFIYPHRNVSVRISWGDDDTVSRVRSAGGQWMNDKKRWKLPLKKALELGLEKSIEMIEDDFNV